MKIIISHDIDHLYWTEHLFKDLFIPKYILKHCWSFLKKDIDYKIFSARITALFQNRMHRLDELITFSKKNNIPAVFFIGMNNGLSLSYSKKAATKIVKHLMSENYEVGLHGIAFDNLNDMKSEKEYLTQLTGDQIGVRNHYLRMSSNTLEFLSRLNFSFDSTTYEISFPKKIKDMWEIPISIMDVSILEGLQRKDQFEEAKNRTLKCLSDANKVGIPYFVINFHDCYYAAAYPVYMLWYEWVINYFKQEGYEFISFANAVKELNMSNKTSVVS